MASSKRGRKFRILLYPDNLDHVSALTKILDFPQFAYVLHDKDVKEDGSPDKPHWHVCVWFSNARFLDALAKELGIDNRFVQLTTNATHDLRYLIHADDPQKYQYDISDVQTSMPLELQKALKDTVEENRVISILDMIDDEKHVIRYSRFIREVCQKGLYSDFRRSWGIFSKCIEEHNNYVYNGVFKPDFDTDDLEGIP